MFANADAIMIRKSRSALFLGNNEWGLFVFHNSYFMKIQNSINFKPLDQKKIPQWSRPEFPFNSKKKDVQYFVGRFDPYSWKTLYPGINPVTMDLVR